MMIDPSMKFLSRNLFGKYTLISSISVGLFLAACKDDGPINELKHDLSIAETKLALAISKIENNLITKIDEDNQYYTIHFESGNPLTVQTQLITKLEYDSLNWLTTFQFQDNTSQSANFLGELHFVEDAIVLNPFLTSPLTAFARIITPVKGKFKVVVKGKPSAGVTIKKSFDYYGDSHELPILGLYENYSNQVEFVFMDMNNKARCSKVLTIPTTIIQNRPGLEIEILKNQLTQTYNGLYIISNLRLGFDQTGEIRWCYNGEGASFFGKLANGNFIVSEASNLNFFEVTMLGLRVKKYNVPNALHHEICELPNGNFLVASHSPPGAPYEDVVVEVGRTSGTVTRTWDFKTILDALRKPLPDTQTGDWLHINALYYDETDNSIVISGRSQCAVVKIDYVTGAIKWILGNHNEWSPAFQPYLLRPVDSNGNQINNKESDFWNYGQHALHRLPNGNLLLYDNGAYRGFYDDPNVPASSYTRLVEYKINEPTKTIELIWQFDNNKSVFTKYTGFAQNLGGTRLAAYMWVSENTPKILEIDKNNQVIYEAMINRGKVSYYRTLKVDVYGGIE